MAELLNTREMDPYSKGFALLEAYDTQYGIYDHTSPNADPDAVFYMHPGEDPYTGGAIENKIKEIIDKRLPEILNISFLEVMHLPHWLLDMFLKNTGKPNSETDLPDLEKEAKVMVEKQLQDLRNKT